MDYSTAATTLNYAIASFTVLGLWIGVNGLVQAAIAAWKDAEHATLPHVTLPVEPQVQLQPQIEEVEKMEDLSVEELCQEAIAFIHPIEPQPRVEEVEDLSWQAVSLACSVELTPRPVLAISAPSMSKAAIAKMKKAQVIAELALWGQEASELVGTSVQLKAKLRALAVPS